MELILVATVHWVHVAFSAYWTGTVLHSRLVVFPALRKLPPEYLPAVRRATSDRRRTLVGAWGTVVFGVLRGILGGVAAQLSTPYGLTFLASLVVGTLMAVWLSGPWPKQTGIFDRLYVAGFPVILALMVAMRFGY